LNRFVNRETILRVIINKTSFEVVLTESSSGLMKVKMKASKAKINIFNESLHNLKHGISINMYFFESQATYQCIQLNYNLDPSECQF